MGGWGLKVPIIFAKALVAKNVWNIIHGSRLWVKMVVQKYIHPLNILEWIRSPNKRKRIFQYVGKLFFGLLTLLGIS